VVAVPRSQLLVLHPVRCASLTLAESRVFCDACRHVVNRESFRTRTIVDDSTMLLVDGGWPVACMVQFLMNEVSTLKAVSSTCVLFLCAMGPHRVL
jgi:hypothetical protein